MQPVGDPSPDERIENDEEQPFSVRQLRENRPATVSETLLELFVGPTGTLSIGRWANGSPERELVLFRKTRFALNASLLQGAQRLAYPQTLELLALVEVEGEPLLASQFLPGVALQELELASRRLETTFPRAVACRIVADALRICSEARVTGNRSPEVSPCVDLHLDTIWLSGTGQVQISEFGLSHLAPVDLDSPLHNVAAAGSLLRQLLKGSLEDEPQLIELLARTSSESERAFESPNEMIEALSALPTASEEEVGATVQGLCGPALVERQAFLFANEIPGAQLIGEEDTACYQNLHEVTPVHSPVDSQVHSPEPPPVATVAPPPKWPKRALALGATTATLAALAWWL